SDGTVTPAERDGLERMQVSLSLRPEEIRAVHARVFGDCLREYAEDDAVSSREVASLVELHATFGRLGWAPGA
ncbi:MAG TPA: hypothetical protein VHC20_01200, partial [Candidatus Paceibacterota bacterium]|nr:hypothetical protein [Candidatus Paceibacterota bacterium]